MLLKTKFARQSQPSNKLSRAKFAYQVLKKEIEKQKNFFSDCNLSKYHALKMSQMTMRLTFCRELTQENFAFVLLHEPLS